MTVNYMLNSHSQFAFKMGFLSLIAQLKMVPDEVKCKALAKRTDKLPQVGQVEIA